MSAPKTKLFYHVDEACSRLGVSVMDLAVLVSAERITLSTAVPGLVVEEGRYEQLPDGTQKRVPESTVEVRGLVALLPGDGWYALRHGSQTVFALAAEPGRYRRIVSGGDEDRGYTVIREEVGVSHAEFARYTALLKSLEDLDRPDESGRGPHTIHAWRAADLEAFRRIYFEGVPESQGALVRHMAAWFASKGLKVPHESTLKRRMRDIWAMFGPEAKPRGP
jgi:hypothetical protein